MNTTAPVQRSRLRLLLKIGAALTFLVLFRKAILKGLGILAVVAIAGYALVSFKHPAPSAAELKAATEAQATQEAADLQQCGPPRPEWKEAELRQLTVCEAALRPVDGIGGVNCWGREDVALADARNRREESERFQRADSARHAWLVAHPGAQQTLPDPSPIKPQPAPLPSPTVAPTPAPISPPMNIHTVDARNFQSLVEVPIVIDPAYGALPADKKALSEQAAKKFLQLYRSQVAGASKIKVFAAVFICIYL